MASVQENAAANILPPQTGKVFAVLANVASISVDISDLAGRFLTLQADGGDIYFLFGDMNVVADPNGAVPPNIAWKIVNGQSVNYWYDINLSRAPQNVTHLAFITTAGTATLRYYVS